MWKNSAELYTSGDEAIHISNIYFQSLHYTLENDDLSDMLKEEEVTGVLRNMK